MVGDCEGDFQKQNGNLDYGYDSQVAQKYLQRPGGFNFCVLGRASLNKRDRYCRVIDIRDAAHSLA